MRSICFVIFAAAILMSQNLFAQNSSQDSGQPQDRKLVIQIKSLNPQEDVLQSASIYSDGQAAVTVAQFVKDQRVTKTRHFIIPLNDDSPFAIAFQTVMATAMYAQKMDPGTDPCFFKHGNFEITALGTDQTMHIVESGDCGGQSIHLPDQVKSYVTTLPDALTLLGTSEEVR